VGIEASLFFAKISGTMGGCFSVPHFAVQHLEHERSDTMSDLIPVVGADDFEAATQSGVVLVDFFAAWCRPCRMQLPILEQLAPDFEGRAKIIKVDTEQAQSVALLFGVQSIPTLIILKDGKKVTQFVGVQQAETLRNALETAIG